MKNYINKNEEYVNLKTKIIISKKYFSSSL